MKKCWTGLASPHHCFSLSCCQFSAPRLNQSLRTCGQRQTNKFDHLTMQYTHLSPLLQVTYFLEGQNRLLLHVAWLIVQWLLVNIHVCVWLVSNISGDTVAALNWQACMDLCEMWTTATSLVQQSNHSIHNNAEQRVQSGTEQTKLQSPHLHCRQDHTLSVSRNSRCWGEW